MYDDWGARAEGDGDGEGASSYMYTHDAVATWIECRLLSE